MQQKKQSNSHLSNHKNISSRVGTQPNSQSQSQQHILNNKEKDDSLVSLVKQFLDKNGYPRSYQALRNEKPVRRIQNSAYNIKNSSNSFSNDEERTIMQLFDKGQREEFFKIAGKLFSPNYTSNFTELQIHHLKRLEFQINIYFCIYSLHPCIGKGPKKGQQAQKSAVEAFKKYIETKGSEVSDESELLVFFSLPYIPKPQQNPLVAHVFTKDWLQKLKSSLQEAIKEHLVKSTATSNKENKKAVYASTLQEIYSKYIDLSFKSESFRDEESKEELEEAIAAKYQQEIQELKCHNKQMVNYLDIIQENLKDLNEASKCNLIESNRKWFQFSKQILQLAKKAVKGEKSINEKLEKYQRFFGSNIDELIYSSADISLFEKNSYFTEDVSMVPGEGQKKMHQGAIANRAGQPQASQPGPIDMVKILMVFRKADQPEFEKEICMVLKALKDRLYYHKNAYTKREVIVSYQRNDICAVQKSNYQIQKKLLLESSDKVKQFYLRLLNHISTDNLGNQYLSSSQKLIENLIGIMGTTNEDVCYRKHVFGILQRFSFIKQSQLMMISFGIIPVIFKIFRSESESLQYASVQYLMGLIMNLAIKKESIVNFEKHKSEIIPILLRYIDVDDNQIKGYVNGTFYVLLQLESIRREAIEKYKLQQIIEALINKCTENIEQVEVDECDLDDSNIVIRQYNYILERLQEGESNCLQEGENANYDDDEEEDEDDDDLDIDMISDNESTASEYLEGYETFVNGQELLMKKYVLVGPEAVREQLLTRSILDETSKKSHNMTTSINHSKRIDRVFHKNERIEAPSLLNGNLDLSITPTRDIIN